MIESTHAKGFVSTSATKIWEARRKRKARRLHQLVRRKTLALCLLLSVATVWEARTDFIIHDLAGREGVFGAG